MPAEIINGWRVTSDSEQFRIFPKNRYGQTVPVTRSNQFLRLQQDGNTIIVKRYLHRGLWYWRISTSDKHQYDLDIQDELSNLLFPVEGLRNGEGRRIGDRKQAKNVMDGFMAGRFAI